MLDEWIQSYLFSLHPFLILKKESYGTKQGVYVFNAWFLMEDGMYGLLSVIHDDTRLLGTMLPKPSVEQLGVAGRKEPSPFDLSRYLLFSEDRLELVLEKKCGKVRMERFLDGVLQKGAEALCGLQCGGYIVKAVSVVEHFWRLAIWKDDLLQFIVNIDVFDPLVMERGVPMEVNQVLNMVLGGVLHESD